MEGTHVTKRTIVDQKCYCGHLSSEHEPSQRPFGGQTYKFGGHGPCRECNCVQFTWQSFVYAED